MHNVICPICKQMVIPEQYCENCGSPLDQSQASLSMQPQQQWPAARTDFYNELPSPDRQQINVVCPKCQAQNPYQVIESQSFYHFVCPRCRTAFISRLVRVRSKNSRGSKKEVKRQFSVRVYDLSGHEDLIEFVNTGYDNFELRARDFAIFSYIGNKLLMVQNLTVGRYMKVSAPWCYVASYVYGPNSDEAQMLRRFRDEVLLSSRCLSAIVTLYYSGSKIAIEKFGESKLFKVFCRTIMRPIVWFLKRFLLKADKRL